MLFVLHFVRGVVLFHSRTTFCQLRSGPEVSEHKYKADAGAMGVTRRGINCGGKQIEWSFTSILAFPDIIQSIAIGLILYAVHVYRVTNLFHSTKSCCVTAFRMKQYDLRMAKQSP